MQITRSHESGGKATAKTLDYGYEINGDKLTVTDDGKRSITFLKRDVVITQRQDERRTSDQWFQLSKETGPPEPDGQAVGRMFSRILRPGTLVFVLSAKENVPMP